MGGRQVADARGLDHAASGRRRRRGEAVPWTGHADWPGARRFRVRRGRKSSSVGVLGSHSFLVSSISLLEAIADLMGTINESAQFDRDFRFS